jgi:hypothetical protein
MSEQSDKADDGVTVTEQDGMISIEVRTCSTVQIPRALLEECGATEGGVGAMVIERMECDLQMDRLGQDPFFTPAIDKKLAAHLAKP